MSYGNKPKRVALDKNPVWHIINDPKFTEKCARRDPELIASLRLLGRRDPEELGELIQQAFKCSTDQRVGKFYRALVDAMTSLAVGHIGQTMFEHCEMPLK